MAAMSADVAKMALEALARIVAGRDVEVTLVKKEKKVEEKDYD